MAHFNYNKPSKLGSELTPEEQRYVLAAYMQGYENGLLGVCYTRADAELNMDLVNSREVDLYMLGQGDGLYKRNNGWAAHL